MNKYSLLKWSKTISYVASGGCGAMFVFASMVDKQHAPLWIAAGGGLISIAGLLGTLFPQPAQAFVKGAEEVHSNGAATGATVATENPVAPTPPT